MKNNEMKKTNDELTSKSKVNASNSIKSEHHSGLNNKKPNNCENTEKVKVNSLSKNSSKDLRVIDAGGKNNKNSKDNLI